MHLDFEKWHGTGNDFIVVDDRDAVFTAGDAALIQRLCDRHFGIGSDGLILIQRPREQDTRFHMEFFNPDASQSFCGNGSRCAFAFWSRANGNANARFTAIDGVHEASWENGSPRISLSASGSIERIAENIDLIHTGSPHLLIWVNDPESVDIVPEARLHRYGPRFAKEGVNVNFLRWHDERVEMRTYERGVEAETLSCGTGVTAAALGAIARRHAEPGTVSVRTRGGDLRVSALRDKEGRFGQAHLSGPAQCVYSGSIET